MTESDPKFVIDAVREIVCLESVPAPDWRQIETVSDKAIDCINKFQMFDQIGFEIYKFLEDYDIRRKDDIYGQGQRASILKLLRQETSNS